AEIIAGRLGELLGVRVLDALLRTKKTLPQKKLGGKEREDNLKKAFAVRADAKDAIKAGRILLVDDIYTTGSTVNSCAALLLEEGACEVGFICACIGKGN
ncbi:MAG: ComF family protein, partial [Lachnospiraceae bacterium]|nr:ComF family protein [Lachnospiraceae bacterium]